MRILALVLMLASALASETYRTVTGIVTNATGAPVENARVYLHNNQPQQNTVTDEFGRYVFRDVDGLGGISFVVNIDGKRPAVTRFATMSSENGRLWIDIKVSDKPLESK